MPGVENIRLDDNFHQTLYTTAVTPAFAPIAFAVGVYPNQVLMASVPLILKASICSVIVGVVVFVILLLMGIVSIYGYRATGDADLNSAGFYGPLLALGCFAFFSWVTPLLVLLFTALVALPLFPIFAYFKLWNLERAIMCCIGPVGFNLTVLPWCLIALVCGGCVLMRCKHEAMEVHSKVMDLIRQSRMDWLMALCSTCSVWNAYASQQSVVGNDITSDWQLLSCIVSTSTLVASIFITCGTSGTLGSIPTQLIKDGATGWVFWASRMVILLKLILSDLVQICILVALHIIHVPFIADFVIYSGFFSLYFLYNNISVIMCSARVRKITGDESHEQCEGEHLLEQ